VLGSIFVEDFVFPICIADLVYNIHLYLVISIKSVEGQKVQKFLIIQILPSSHKIFFSVPTFQTPRNILFPRDEKPSFVPKRNNMWNQSSVYFHTTELKAKNEKDYELNTSRNLQDLIIS
jgi:hypothetical protein